MDKEDRTMRRFAKLIGAKVPFRTAREVRRIRRERKAK
jgi:hypothetical protein